MLQLVRVEAEQERVREREQFLKGEKCLSRAQAQ
jgi:hypothetical protein